MSYVLKFTVTSIPSHYLISLSAHKQHTQHIENLHFVHDLVYDLHRLGQPVSEWTRGQGALIRWLWKTANQDLVRPNNAANGNTRAGKRRTSPVLLCSASSIANCMRASRTNALSSQLCQSSSSSRAEASAASVTFRVASLQRRSIKPGIFTRVTAERSHGTVKCIVLFYMRAIITLSTFCVD